MNSLKNHFLISLPHMKDPLFKRTVIFICEHDKKGAMGLIINKEIEKNNDSFPNTENDKELIKTLLKPKTESNTIIIKLLNLDGALRTSINHLKQMQCYSMN